MHQTPKTVSVGSLSKKETIIPILIIGALFFIFGFISWVNAILIPFFKIACELTNFESYLVTFAFYISYLVFSLPSSYLLKRIGFRKGMMIGFWIMAVGAFVFIPAAMTRLYWIFLIGLFSIGAGTALLQTAANPYITILGPKQRAAQRISVMGIFNKVAGLLAPLIFAAVILKSTDQQLFQELPQLTDGARELALDALISRVILPYAVIGVLLIGLGLMIRYSSLPEIDTEHEPEQLRAENANKSKVLHFPQLVLGAVAIFLHLGTQVISIDTIISYAGSMHIGLLEAKVFPSYTLFAMIVGYVIGIWLIPKYISQVKVFQICCIVGLLFSFGIIYGTSMVRFLDIDAPVSIWFVVLLGLPNSLVWAGIWPLAMDGLGRFTKVGASILVMGLAGNAIMPLIYGYFADLYHPRTAYWVLVPCYLFLGYYAVWGHRLRSWQPGPKNKASPANG